MAMFTFFKKKQDKAMENRRQQIIQISNVLEGLQKKLLDALENELKVFQVEADMFYASPESRDADACATFRNKYFTKRDKAATQAGLSYINSQGAESEAAYQKAIDFFKPKEELSADDFYSYVRWGYIANTDFTQQEKTDIDKKRGQRIRDLSHQWIYACKEAIKKYWKPIYVLSGSYGQCEDCLCYDEEFDKFFRLWPDDNYYHWGSYILRVISKEDAEKELGENVDFQKQATVSPFFKTYFPSFESCEIESRITKLPIK